MPAGTVNSYHTARINVVFVVILLRMLTCHPTLNCQSHRTVNIHVSQLVHDIVSCNNSVYTVLSVSSVLAM